MKDKLMKLGMQGIAMIGALSPVLAFAQVIPQKALPQSGVTTPEQAGNLLCNIAGWMFYFLVILAIIFVLYAAFTYLTAGGDAEKVGSANQMLIYAVVAIVVGILARSVPGIVSGFVNSTVITGC